MKALVTGGCGFIGSHLVDMLVEHEVDVLVVDNESTGRASNIRAHLESGAARLIRGDVNNAEVMEGALAGRTHVFHLAALADIVPSIVNPMNYFESNVRGTAVVMEASRKARVEKVVYAASSSCYGIPDTYPTPETAELRPQYPYALTKLLGEQVVRHWESVYGVPTVSLRLFNVFGPRARTSGTYGAVFGVFLAQKLAGVPMTIVGDGEQSRDFTFVRDVARAFVMSSESTLSGQVMNVGSGSCYSVNYLADLLGGPTTHIPKRPGEPDMTFGSIELIQRSLGWAPQIPFEDGVTIMLENIEYWRDAPVWNPATIADATREWFRFLG